jgi:putative membrane protein
MPLFASVLVAQIWSDLASFGMAIVATLVFGAIGIVLAVVGFKLFDMLTPGKLDDEILQKQNVAAAVLAGSFILGICIIIAAAIHG